jgi:hypothetical protein
MRFILVKSAFEQNIFEYFCTLPLCPCQNISNYDVNKEIKAGVTGFT